MSLTLFALVFGLRVAEATVCVGLLIVLFTVLPNLCGNSNLILFVHLHVQVGNLKFKFSLRFAQAKERWLGMFRSGNSLFFSVSIDQMNNNKVILDARTK